MQVFCRKAGGKDPLGAIEFINVVNNQLTEEEAILASWALAENFNRGRKLEHRIVTLHCGDTLLDVKTGKLRSLTGKIKGNLERQPALDMPNKAEPRLL